MRVDIKGNNPITSDQFKFVIDDLNERYKNIGIKVKNATMYVRFVNANGDNVELVDDNNQLFDRIYRFNKTNKTSKDVPSGSIPLEHVYKFESDRK